MSASVRSKSRLGNAGEECFGKGGFAQFKNFDRGFDPLLHHQFIDENRLILADTVSAIRGLVLHRRVPPRVVMDDRIRSRQVKARSSRFEA